MLRQNERALLLAHCNDHVIAVCPECSESVTFDRVAADVIMGRRDFCPVCRTDLTTGLREHLARCTVVRVQERESRARSRHLLRNGPDRVVLGESPRDAQDAG